MRKVLTGCVLSMRLAEGTDAKNLRRLIPPFAGSGRSGVAIRSTSVRLHQAERNRGLTTRPGARRPGGRARLDQPPLPQPVAESVDPMVHRQALGRHAEAVAPLLV